MFSKKKNKKKKATKCIIKPRKMERGRKYENDGDKDGKKTRKRSLDYNNMI